MRAPVPVGGVGRVTRRGTVKPRNDAPGRGVIGSGESSGTVSGAAGASAGGRPAVSRSRGAVSLFWMSPVMGTRAQGRDDVKPGEP